MRRNAGPDPLQLKAMPTTPPPENVRAADHTAVRLEALRLALDYAQVSARAGAALAEPAGIVYVAHIFERYVSGGGS